MENYTDGLEKTNINIKPDMFQNVLNINEVIKYFLNTDREGFSKFDSEQVSSVEKIVNYANSSPDRNVKVRQFIYLNATYAVYSSLTYSEKIYVYVSGQINEMVLRYTVNGFYNIGEVIRFNLNNTANNIAKNKLDKKVNFIPIITHGRMACLKPAKSHISGLEIQYVPKNTIILVITPLNRVCIQRSNFKNELLQFIISNYDKFRLNPQKFIHDLFQNKIMENISLYLPYQKYGNLIISMINNNKSQNEYEKNITVIQYLIMIILVTIILLKIM